MKKSFFGKGRVNIFFRENILSVLEDKKFISRNDCVFWFTALLNYFHEKYGLSRVVIRDADQKFFESEYLFAYLNAKKLKIEIKQEVKKVGKYCAWKMSGGSVVFDGVGSVKDHCAHKMFGGSLVFKSSVGSVGDLCAESMSGGSVVFGDVGSVGYSCAYSMRGGRLVFGGDIFSYVKNVYSEKKYLKWVESLFKDFNEKGIKVDKSVFEFHEASQVTIFSEDILRSASIFKRGKSGVFFRRRFANRIAKWFEKEDTIFIITKLDLLGLKEYFNKKNEDTFFTDFFIPFLGIVYNSLKRQDAEKFLINIKEKLDSGEGEGMISLMNIKYKPITLEIQKKYK